MTGLIGQTRMKEQALREHHATTLSTCLFGLTCVTSDILIHLYYIQYMSRYVMLSIMHSPLVMCRTQRQAAIGNICILLGFKGKDAGNCEHSA